MKFLLTLLTMIISSTALSAATETKTFDINNLKELEISAEVSKVSVATTKADKATVIFTKNKVDKNCKISAEKVENELRIKTEQTSKLFKNACDVDITVQVPKDLNVEIKVGMGKIGIVGTQGEVDFQIGKGEVNVDGIISEVEGKTGQGNVVIKGLVGDAEIRTGNGDVNLTYSTVPTKGEAKIKTGKGNTVVTVPKNSKVTTALKAGHGSSKNEVGETPKAGFKISMDVGMGDLLVKAL